MPKRDVAEPSARERLLAAAGELFYAEGVQTVGIDRIIAHAGVAKASLYNIFGSKEELVRAYQRPLPDGADHRRERRQDRRLTPLRENSATRAATGFGCSRWWG